MASIMHSGAEKDDPCTENGLQNAASRVLSITELLEQILTDLPMKDLLLAQRTCKTWKNCINGSQTLRKKLFFTTNGSPVVDRICGLRSENHDKVIKASTLNPLLAASLSMNALSTMHFNKTTATLCGGDGFSYPRASWRKMVIVQPPLPEVRADKEGKWSPRAIVAVLLDEIFLKQQGIDRVRAKVAFVEIGDLEASGLKG